MRIDSGVVEVIEGLVNSYELEMVSEDAPWSEYIWPYLEYRIKEQIPPDGLTENQWQTLHDDLRDWWKNGNLYHWEDDDTNAFGMGRWRLGDPDFPYDL